MRFDDQGNAFNRRVACVDTGTIGPLAPDERRRTLGEAK